MKHSYRSIITLAALATAVALSGCSTTGEEEDSITRESALSNDDAFRKAAYEQVMAEYLFCLGRGADTTGLAIWAYQIERGDVAPEDLRSAICNSNEGKLAELYFNLLARDPDSNGLGYWLAELGRGFSLDEIANAIRSGAEFRAVTEGKKLDFQAVRQSRALEARVRMLRVKALLAGQP